MDTTGVLGGTFDSLHDGHHALLITAFQHGDHIIVGITTDALANDTRSRTVTPLEVRIEHLRDACKTYGNVFNATFTITPIDDPYGPAITHEEADFLVISPEQKTHERAATLNNKRTKEGRNRLQIIEAPLVTDDQGERISSTAIAQGRINTHGDTVADAPATDEQQ